MQLIITCCLTVLIILLFKPRIVYCLKVIIDNDQLMQKRNVYVNLVVSGREYSSFSNSEDEKNQAFMEGMKRPPYGKSTAGLGLGRGVCAQFLPSVQISSHHSPAGNPG